MEGLAWMNNMPRYPFYIWKKNSNKESSMQFHIWAGFRLLGGIRAKTPISVFYKPRMVIDLLSKWGWNHPYHLNWVKLVISFFLSVSGFQVARHRFFLTK